MKSLLLLITLSLFLGCSKSEKTPEEPKNTDLVSFSVQLPVDESSIKDPQLSQLIKNINAGKQVSFKQITKFFIKKHANEYTNKYDPNFQSASLESYIKELSTNLKPNSYLTNKQKYENVHKSIYDKDNVYNLDAVTMGHILSENRRQCFSGTALDLSITRTISKGTEYRSNNFVVIMQKGHVLPGQMVKETNGTFTLYGLEMTQLGNSSHSYGPAAELNADELLVVDAEYYVLSFLIKNNFKSTREKLKFRDQMLDMAAKKYGIKENKQLTLDELEQMTSNNVFTITNQNNNDAFNSNLWSFGSSDVEAGDQPITERSTHGNKIINNSLSKFKLKGELDEKDDFKKSDDEIKYKIKSDSEVLSEVINEKKTKIKRILEDQERKHQAEFIFQQGLLKSNIPILRLHTVEKMLSIGQMDSTAIQTLEDILKNEHLRYKFRSAKLLLTHNPEHIEAQALVRSLLNQFGYPIAAPSIILSIEPENKEAINQLEKLLRHNKKIRFEAAAELIKYKTMHPKALEVLNIGINSIDTGNVILSATALLKNNPNHTKAKEALEISLKSKWWFADAAAALIKLQPNHKDAKETLEKSLVDNIIHKENMAAITLLSIDPNHSNAKKRIDRSLSLFKGELELTNIDAAAATLKNLSELTLIKEEVFEVIEIIPAI